MHLQLIQTLAKELEKARDDVQQAENTPVSAALVKVIDALRAVLTDLVGK